MKTAPVVSAAPSVSLPLRFVVTGLLSLFIGASWLIARPDLLTTYHYNQFIIALTHLFVLGWLGSVVMGAMYQLVPVALETKLYSERLAKWQFVIHVVAFAGMVWMFRKWDMKQVGHFGSAMAIGVGLFVYNLARTLLRVPKWNVIATAIASALGWFSLTVIAGLSIAAAKCSYESTEGLVTAGGVRQVVNGLRAVGAFMSHFDAINAMHAHAHLGVVGFFTLLLVGVSYKLIPMFTLGEIQSRRRANLSVWLLNAGLLGSVVSILLRSQLKFVFALVIVAALAIYGWELAAIVRGRRRTALDWGVKSFLTAVAMLVPLALLAAVLAWPGLPLNEFTGQLENLYGFLGLIGFLTFAIIGMLHKIIPFLVWFHTYSPHVGRAQLPALADLYSERVQIASFWIWQAGLIATSAGILLQNVSVTRSGAILLATSLAVFAVNIGKILSHVARPVLKPFSTPAAK
ncbi:MAG: cbb3-type cytochrome c oxidase subunit I [Verrucomicrobiota bacterium]